MRGNAFFVIQRCPSYQPSPINVVFCQGLSLNMLTFICHLNLKLAVNGVKEVLLKPWCKTYYFCKFVNTKNLEEGFWRTCEFLR